MPNSTRECEFYEHFRRLELQFLDERDPRYESFTLIALNTISTILKDRKLSDYDPIIARAVRTRKYTTTKKFLKAIGHYTPSNEAILSTFETGRRAPRNPPQTLFQIDYMRFLANEGYNFYNIDFEDLDRQTTTSS
jgi:hypothetical protein